MGIILGRKCKEMISVDKNWIFIINVIVVAIFVICVVKGWKRGALRMILEIGGTLIAVYLAYVSSNMFAGMYDVWPEKWIPENLSLISGAVYPLFNRIAWFFIVFLAVKVILFVLDKVLKIMQKVPVWKQIMSILGSLLGLVEGWIWCMILSLVLCTPLFSNGATIADKTWLNTIQLKENSTLTTILKPFYETQDIMKIFSDINDVTNEQMDVLQDYLEKNGQ